MTGTQHNDPTTPLTASVGTWQLDTKATTIELHTKALWGMVKVKGSLTALRGSGTVDSNGSVSGTLIIDAASINTGRNVRDKHLRTADFFNVAQYPTFEYLVTSVHVGTAGAATISGTFSARGQTHPLQVQAQVTGIGTDRITVTGQTDLDRSQWGMDWTKRGATRLENHLVVTAVFTR
jgi:polyisoprenoid-binding protein YceI